ncbi:hypothetical protein KI387_039564, partial [Taxus chinensis]
IVDALCTSEVDLVSLGLQRESDDVARPLTTYSRHLLQLGEAHDLLILNGISSFPDSQFFTCRSHGGGASVVDY